MKFILFLFSALQFTAAFAPGTFGVRNQQVLFAGQRDNDSGGGAALAKPAVKIAQKTDVKAKEKVKQTSKAKTHDPISRRDEDVSLPTSSTSCGTK